MTYVKEYEQYKYKPLRALLLIAAIATDIAAVLSIVAALFKPVLLAAAAGCIIAGLIMRRISLHAVYSYEYALCDNRLSVSKKIIGKSVELISITRRDIKSVTPYDGDSRAEKMYIGDIGGVYAVETVSGRRAALKLDNYTYSIIAGEVEL